MLRKRPHIACWCIVLLAAMLISGCGGGASSTPPAPTPTTNATPSITNLSPSSALLGSGPQQVTINGTGFSAASVVSVNGASHTATFVNSQQLTVTLTATDLAAPGNLTFVVTNPPPGGGASSAAPFAVVGASLQVNIISLPAGVQANIQVTGPNGLNTKLTSNQTVVGGSGLYTVTSAGVTVGPNTFFPTVAVQSANIQVGSVSTITVDYHTIIPNTTKVLDSPSAQSLTVSALGDSISLSATSPVAQALAPGDVLVSGPSPGAPHGLLVKIVSLSSVAGTLIAAVQPAALEDVIQQGSITFTSPGGPAAAQLRAIKSAGVASPAQAAIVSPLPDSCATVPQKFVVPFELITGPVKESGSIEICPGYNFTFDISGGKLQSLHATINAGIHSDLTVAALAAAPVDFTHDFPFLVTAPIVVFLDIPPVPIPIVLNLKLTPFVSLSGTLTGFSTTLSDDAVASVGVSYLAGVISPVHSLALNFSPATVAFDAQFDMKGQLGVRLELLVYGGTLLSVAADDFLQFQSSPTANPWWVLNGGFEGPGAIQLSIAGHNIGSLTFPDIFGITLPIAHAPGPFAAADVTPVVASVTPNQTQSGVGDLTIAVSGSNFVGTDVVQFKGSPLTTTVVDSQNLTAVVPAAALAVPGSFPLTVADSGVPTLVSNAASFTVVGSGINPVPVISSLSPASFVAGSAQQTLTINGSNFVGTSSVTINSVAHPATFVSPTQLSVVLAPADLAGPGSFSVVVNNPAPGGGPSNASPFTVTNAVGIINTIAGVLGPGFSGDGGPALQAHLSGPSGVAFDAAGNMYIAEEANHIIRKVDVHTGIITTLAGDPTFAGFAGDGGPAAAARLFAPKDVAVDSAGNIYIADSWNVRIRKIDTDGVISTIAGDGIAGFSGDGGPATSAHLGFPTGVKVDAAGNLYIADSENNRLRKVDPSGIITTIAGTGTAGFSGDGGPATAAALNFPIQPALDAAGNIYIADYQNRRVRRIDAQTGIITTVAGNGQTFFPSDGGPATNSAISGPQSIILDPSSGALLVADIGNIRVRAVNVTPSPITVAGVTVQPGNIETIAGTGVEGYTGDGGPAIAARLFNPCGFTLDQAGNFVFADYFNAVVRKITLH